jgi:hypothetical protein
VNGNSTKPAPWSPRYARFAEQELRAMFTDSFGPLVEPFPDWPGLWHDTCSTAASYIRAVDPVRLRYEGAAQVYKMIAPVGSRIKPTKPAGESVSTGIAIKFPEWVR